MNHNSIGRSVVDNLAMVVLEQMVKPMFAGVWNDMVALVVAAKVHF